MPELTGDILDGMLKEVNQGKTSPLFTKSQYGGHQYMENDYWEKRP